MHWTRGTACCHVALGTWVVPPTQRDTAVTACDALRSGAASSCLAPGPLCLVPSILGLWVMQLWAHGGFSELAPDSSWLTADYPHGTDTQVTVSSSPAPWYLLGEPQRGARRGGQPLLQEDLTLTRVAPHTEGSQVHCQVVLLGLRASKGRGEARVPLPGPPLPLPKLSPPGSAATMAVPAPRTHLRVEGAVVLKGLSTADIGTGHLQGGHGCESGF